MDDGVLSSPDRASTDATPHAPRSPVGISDEAVAEFQKLMREECGVEMTLEQARKRGSQLVELYRLLLDPEGYERRTTGIAATNHTVYPVDRPRAPEPSAFPIPLDRDDIHEIRSNLALVVDELGKTKQRPNSWRWAVVALYNVLGHCLVRRRRIPARDPLRHLMELFDAVAEGDPEMRSYREAVQTLERLRTTWVPYGVERWPIGRADLRRLFGACLDLLHRLDGRTVPRDG